MAQCFLNRFDTDTTGKAYASIGVTADMGGDVLLDASNVCDGREVVIILLVSDPWNCVIVALKNRDGKIEDHEKEVLLSLDALASKGVLVAKLLNAGEIHRQQVRVGEAGGALNCEHVADASKVRYLKRDFEPGCELCFGQVLSLFVLASVAFNADNGIEREEVARLSKVDKFDKILVVISQGCLPYGVLCDYAVFYFLGVFRFFNIVEKVCEAFCVHIVKFANFSVTIEC